MRLFRLFVVTAITSLPCSSFCGQTQPSAKLEIGHDFWGFKDNAPQGTLAFAQTSDGFLWLGTPLGLYRFDGTRFELFHSTFGDQLLSTNIYALLAPPSGGLWIGYAFGGFSFLNNDGRVTNYGGEIASSTGSVANFAQNANEALWAATGSGLWKFDYSHWQHIEPESGLPAGSIREARFDQDGTLWVLTGVATAPGQVTKLAYLRPGSSRFQTAQSDLEVFGFTLDADGRVVTSPEARLFFKDNSEDSVGRPQAYPVLRRKSLQIVDRTLSVWIILEAVMLRVEATRRLSDVVHEPSPKNSQTYDISVIAPAKLVDREGNIWFGEQNGVHRFFYSPLIRQELPTNQRTSFTVTAGDQGSVWITAGTGNVKLFHVANGQVEPRNSHGGFVGFTYRSPDKTVWFGRANGLWRLVDGNLVRVDLPKEMADQSPYLQTITQDPNGGMWVSFGRHGLYRLADGVWTPYGGREDLPKTGVVIAFTDSLGRVWFGCTKSQLAVLDGDHVQVFGPNDGIRVGNITAIYGRGSEIWIGGEFGLQQFDHGRFHNIQANDNELLRGISGIVETANGDLWLNGLGGIFHVRRSEIAEALNNSAYLVKGEHFGTREGLPGFPFQLRPLNTAIEGTDGRIWFATSGGVVWIDPAHPKKNVPPPPLTIQSVSADDKNYLLGSELKFPAKTSSVQISYAAISLSDPAAVRFRYKLQESDGDWHEVPSASPVSYRNLAPGSYHFSVMATDTNGVWSDKVASLEFSILPAFYQTTWFRSLCVVAFVVLLGGLYQVRLRQLARQYNARLEGQVSERTRIARELHDTLLQSFQALLLRLQVVSDSLNAGDSKQRLDRAIDQTAQAIVEGRDAVQALRCSANVKNDLPEALRTLGEEIAGGQCKDTPVFEVDVEGMPCDLHPVLRDEVYRIAGEALRNAFQHAQASRIEIEMHYDDRQFQLRIRDDGKGIDPQAADRSTRVGHFGLHGMRERAKLIGANLEVWSKAESGTEIDLTLPASTAYVRTAAQHRPWFIWRETGVKS